MCLLECEFIKVLNPNVIYVCKSFALRWGAPKGTRHWIENFFSLFPTYQILSEGGLCFQSRFYHYSVFTTMYFKVQILCKKNSLSGSLLYEWIPLILQIIGFWCYCSTPNLPKRSKIYVVWRSFLWCYQRIKNLVENVA